MLRSFVQSCWGFAAQWKARGKGVVHEHANTGRLRTNDLSKDECAYRASRLCDAPEQHDAAPCLWPHHPEFFNAWGRFLRGRPGNCSDLLIGESVHKNMRA